jgi:hypothetical protein
MKCGSLKKNYEISNIRVVILGKERKLERVLKGIIMKDLLKIGIHL